MIDPKLKEWSVAGILAAAGFTSVFNVAGNNDQKITDMLSNRDQAIVTQMTTADQELTRQIATIVDKFHNLNASVGALDIVVQNTINEIASVRQNLRELSSSVLKNKDQITEMRSEMRVRSE